MSKAAKAATHRLTNIDVLEVSVVDKAANKRRWLIAKRADSEPGTDSNPTPPAPAPANDGQAELVQAALAFFKANKPGEAPAPAPSGGDKETTEALAKATATANDAMAKVAELTKALGEVQASVTKQAETIAAQGAALKKAADDLAEANKTITGLRSAVNEQAEVIRNARLAKVSNADGDDPKRPPAPTDENRGETAWPIDMNGHRRRRQ